MKYLSLIILLFISTTTFSQNKTKAKSKIYIQFDNCKDTIFTGIQNMILVKGITDYTGVSVQLTEGEVITCDNIKNCYFVIPTVGKKTADIIIIKDKKEIYRRKVVIAVLEGKHLEMIKKKKGIK